MATWCLPKQFADKFKTALVEKKINPGELSNMSTEARRKFLAQFVGEENVKKVNTLFESKLLLKNQQQGMITWAKTIAGLKEKKLNDVITKIQKLDRALNPAEKQQFLSDIVEQRLGTAVSPDEAGVITKLSREAQELFDPKKELWEQVPEYWQKKQELVKYIREISPKQFYDGTWDVIRKNVPDFIGLLRSVKTGFDLSAPGRQGLALFGTKAYGGSFKRMFKYAMSPSAMDELEIRMMSSRYAKELFENKSSLGLTMLGEKLTQKEEQFASSLAKKIPLLRGSERAYVGFLNDLRFTHFTNILENLDKAGKSITDNPKAMRELAEVIGAATGRGKIAHGAGALSTVLFSPRWLVSRFQMLANPITKTGPARAEAIKSLARLAGVATAVLGTYKLAFGKDIETDPRSTDFGKLKVGNTRFDVTGGMGPVIVLLSRIGAFLADKPAVKSGTGETYKLNSGAFASRTAQDLVTDFVLGKASPMASVVRDTFKGEDFEGNKLKFGANKEYIKYIADALIMPLIGSDVYETYKDSGGDVSFTAGTAIATGLGFGGTTYGNRNTWAQSTSKELTGLREQLGDAKFEEAGQKYADKLNSRMKELNNDPEYKKLSDAQKEKVKSRTKSKIKREIFEEYDYTPEPTTREEDEDVNKFVE